MGRSVPERSGNMYDHNYYESGAPVRAARVYDSCSDKDCFTGLPVALDNGTLAPEINILRSRSAQVGNISVNVEPVPFNRGFYQTDLTFTFDIEIAGYANSGAEPVIMRGKAYAAKSCILYGSESSVKTFFSSDAQSVPDNASGLPVAAVSVLEPIVLETRIEPLCGDERQSGQQRGISVTLGLFSVVELIRPTTIMVPTMEYSIPQRECFSESESPCEIFGRLKFPEEEFIPLSLNGSDSEADESVTGS